MQAQSVGCGKQRRKLREQDSLRLAPQFAQCIGTADVRMSLQRGYDALEAVFIERRQSTP
jgi:hypothetical protein